MKLLLVAWMVAILAVNQTSPAGRERFSSSQEVSPPPTRTLLCPNSTPVHILGNNVDLRVKLSVHIMPTTI